MKIDDIKNHILSNPIKYTIGGGVLLTAIAIKLLNVTYVCETTFDGVQTICVKSKISGNPPVKTFVSSTIGTCPAPHPQCP